MNKSDSMSVAIAVKDAAKIAIQKCRNSTSDQSVIEAVETVAENLVAIAAAEAKKQYDK